MGEYDILEAGQMAHQSRHSSSNDEKEPEKIQKSAKKVPSTSSFEISTIPLVDLGMDVGGIFPATVEDMDIQGMLALSLGSVGYEEHPPSW